MIAHIFGKVLFSDGQQMILTTSLGVSYELVFYQKVEMGKSLSLFVSHIFRENAQELYGFHSLQEKKLFELLMSVKGVGPKSSYGLLAALGPEEVINAILLENKKSLSKAPGIGAKAAAQICLDLSQKIRKLHEFENFNFNLKLYKADDRRENTYTMNMASEVSDEEVSHHRVVEETIMACKELGFQESDVVGKIRKLTQKNQRLKSEELLQLVLKSY